MWVALQMEVKRAQSLLSESFPGHVTLELKLGKSWATWGKWVTFGEGETINEDTNFG